MKNISIILAVFALVFTSVSCESYDDYETERATIIGFTQTNVNIKVPNNGTRDKTVDVFITESSNVDRTFNISVVADQTDVASENYSIASSVEILANERVGTFTITGVDVSLTDEKLPLTLRVEPSNGVIAGATLVTALIYK